MTTQPDNAPPDDAYPEHFKPARLRQRPPLQRDDANPYEHLTSGAGRHNGPTDATAYPSNWLPKTMKEDL
jgi:hypothetical protein